MYLVLFSDSQNSDSLSNRLTALRNQSIYTLTIHRISCFDIMVAIVLKKAALCCFGL